MLSDFEDIRSQIPSSGDPYICPYDGFLSVSGNGWSRNYCSITVNGTSFTFAGSYDDAAANGGIEIAVKKGDTVLSSANNSNRNIYMYARWYKYREL